MSKYKSIFILVFLISQSWALPLGSRWPEIYLGIKAEKDLVVTCAESMSLPQQIAEKIVALDSSCDALYDDDQKFCDCFRQNTGSGRHSLLMEKVHKEIPRLNALYRQMLYTKLEASQKVKTGTLIRDLAKADLQAKTAGFGERACYKKLMNTISKEEAFYYSKTLISRFYNRYTQSRGYELEEKKVAQSQDVIGGLTVDNFCEVPVAQMFNIMKHANASKYDIRNVFSIDDQNREAAIGGLQRLQDFLKEDSNSQSLMNAYYCYNFDKVKEDHKTAMNEEKMMGKEEKAKARIVFQELSNSEMKLQDLQLAEQNTEVAFMSSIKKLNGIIGEKNRLKGIIESRSSTPDEIANAKEEIERLNEEYAASITRKDNLSKELSEIRKQIKLAEKEFAQNSKKASQYSEAFINTQRDRRNADSSAFAFSNDDSNIVEGRYSDDARNFMASVDTSESSRVVSDVGRSSIATGFAETKEVEVSNDVFASETSIIPSSLNVSSSFMASNMPLVKDSFINPIKGETPQIESAADIIRDGVGQINEAAREHKRIQEEKNAEKLALEKKVEEEKSTKKAFDLFNESNSKISALEARLAQLEKEKKELEKKAKASKAKKEIVKASPIAKAQSPFKTNTSSNFDRSPASSKGVNDSIAKSSGSNNAARSNISAPSSSGPSGGAGPSYVSSRSITSSGASAKLSLTEVKGSDIKTLPKSLVMSVDQKFMTMSPSEQEVYLDGLVAGNEFIYVKFPDGKIVKVEGKEELKKQSNAKRSVASVDDEKADILRQIERARQRHADLKALMNKAKVEK